MCMFRLLILRDLSRVKLWEITQDEETIHHPSSSIPLGKVKIIEFTFLYAIYPPGGGGVERATLPCEKRKVALFNFLDHFMVLPFPQSEGQYHGSPPPSGSQPHFGLALVTYRGKWTELWKSSDIDMFSGVLNQIFGQRDRDTLQILLRNYRFCIAPVS